ncbi:MAG: thioredoxin domain-containing protein [Actinomycetaceae bacterium]|nr:thioredoxin domain-containing protein [Actinomycetaceae bacterium]MDU0971182.1 thioredoxin domain-containing protein [Actinomycetaceae bacterium]
MTSLPPINLDEIEKVVAAADRPVLIDFWAPWCGYCLRNLPIVEQLAADEADRLSVYALNVDDNEGAREQFAIQTIPSYVLYVDGKMHVIRGSQTRKALLEAIDKARDE